MDSKKCQYKLKYLPLFYEDLNDKVTYIQEVLGNNEAANSLIDRIEDAINKRLPHAESFEKYKSNRERKYSYYRIYVGNYIIFYVVIIEDECNKIMEVRRLLYNKQNEKSFL